MTKLPHHGYVGPQAAVWTVYHNFGICALAVYSSPVEQEARDMMANFRRDNPQKVYFLDYCEELEAV